MSEALAITPSPPPTTGAEPTVAELAALIPDSALVGDPSSVAGTPPAPAENTADAADAARLTQTTEGEAPAPAPAEGEAPAPAETKTEPAPAEQVDTEALERAEQAAKRAREGSRRYRQMLEEQNRVRQEAQRAAQEAERARREAEEARKLQESWKKDPYKTLKGLGMTDQELAERALREGTPEALIFELKEKLEQEAQARAALEQRLESERAELARQRAEQNFTRLASDEGAYPRLAQLDGPAQLAIARAALQQIENNGYSVAGLSDEQVAEACERFLTPRRPGKAAAPKPNPAPAPAAKPQTPAPASKTLTNAVSTQRAVAPREWHEMTEDEQIAAIAAALPDPA